MLCSALSMDLPSTVPLLFESVGGAVVTVEVVLLKTLSTSMDAILNPSHSLLDCPRSMVLEASM